MYHIRKQTCVSTTALKEQIYIPSSILRAGDDVEIRTEAAAGHKWHRGQGRRPRQEPDAQKLEREIIVLPALALP